MNSIMTVRQERIIADLERETSLDTHTLAERLGVSEMTIRRDLAALQTAGKVQRTHGGVLLAHTVGAEQGYAAKQKTNSSTKARIGRYAASELVSDGDIILLDGGTTVTAMAQYLHGKRGLTVVTNGLYTTNELSFLLPEATVLSCGGVLRDVSFTYVGPVAESFFDSFRGDKLFISTAGLTLEQGYTDPNPLEAATREHMMAAAGQVIVLLDSSKFGTVSLVQTAPADRFPILVTDAGAPPETLASLRAMGVDVRVVS